MPKRHWTAESAEAFAHKIAFDFIAQLEERIEMLGINHCELAKRLGVSEGAVSQVLNNPQNLTLKTIAKYSRVLGIKATVVAYDDGDSENTEGLIPSRIFSTCWERSGKPRDQWEVEVSHPVQATSGSACAVFHQGVNRTLRFVNLLHASLTKSESSSAVIRALDSFSIWQERTTGERMPCQR